MNSSEFNTAINQEGLVLVDFWAEWCGPCRALAPVLDQLTDIKLVKIDVDESNEVATNAIINAVPTLILYKDGKEVWRDKGLQPRAKLQEIIDRNK